jgi:hypothetical protein
MIYEADLFHPEIAKKKGIVLYVAFEDKKVVYHRSGNGVCAELRTQKAIRKQRAAKPCSNIRYVDNARNRVCKNRIPPLHGVTASSRSKDAKCIPSNLYVPCAGVKEKIKDVEETKRVYCNAKDALRVSKAEGEEHFPWAETEILVGLFDKVGMQYNAHPIWQV